MTEYQTVIIRLQGRSREDEEAITDLLNERARMGWRFNSLTQLESATGFDQRDDRVPEVVALLTVFPLRDAIPAAQPVQLGQDLKQLLLDVPPTEALPDGELMKSLPATDERFQSGSGHSVNSPLCDDELDQQYTSTHMEEKSAISCSRRRRACSKY
jgi:hypothetical protein